MNRDMYYQNLNQGYVNPGMVVPPSGYNLNSNYQAFGPNVAPNMMGPQNAMPTQNMMPAPNMMQSSNMMQNSNITYQDSYEDFSDKFNKIDKQIKNLDTRLQKLEASANAVNENIYMI